MKRFMGKALVSFMVLCLLFTSVFLGTSALADKSELPTVQKWVNGAAQASDGSFLRDTWAVDGSGVSDSKYVLINQDSTEALRVKNYPDDVSAGNSVSLPTYSVDISLSVPETLRGEVILTFENNAATYSVSFTEESDYKGSGKFYPGEYQITDIEALMDSEGVYQFSEPITLSVAEKNLSVSWKLERVSGETADNTNKGASDDEKTDVIGTISGFDNDGDLLSDTIKLVVALMILFAVYGFVKYRRKKKEELEK